jgi:uncharacterized protein YndB with AHSA1/START domain
VADKRTDVIESAADREIVLTRVFDAPREMVWGAWTDKGVFTDVVPYERLSYRLSGGRKGAPVMQFESMVTFVEEDGKTVVKLRMVFASAEARDRNVREYGSIEGGNQTLERLAQHLSGRLSATTNGGMR